MVVCLFPPQLSHPSHHPPALVRLAKDKSQAKRWSVSGGTGEVGRKAAMKKHWLIRNIFIGLLALCAVFWAGSYWRATEISHDGVLGTAGESLRMSDGRISIDKYYIVDDPSATQPKWTYSSESFSPEAARARGWDFYERSKYRCLGFSLEPWSSATIPLWFPTLLFALLLWFVWRKTKAKPVGGAFPVEPAKAGERQP